MLYVHTTNENGVITCTPITNDNVYVFCKRCRNMVQILDLSNLLNECEWDDVDGIDMCDECLEEVCKLEEEYVKHYYKSK